MARIAGHTVGHRGCFAHNRGLDRNLALGQSIVVGHTVVDNLDLVGDILDIDSFLVVEYNLQVAVVVLDRAGEYFVVMGVLVLVEMVVVRGMVAVVEEVPLVGILPVGLACFGVWAWILDCLSVFFC
jgi:hypothetical protein